jgi:hypothetical protein
MPFAAFSIGSASFQTILWGYLDWQVTDDSVNGYEALFIKNPALCKKRIVSPLGYYVKFWVGAGMETLAFPFSTCSKSIFLGSVISSRQTPLIF